LASKTARIANSTLIRAHRPRATRDRRTESTYLFGAVCLERGTGAVWRVKHGVP
jgi:hypothetical protein